MDSNPFGRISLYMSFVYLVMSEQAPVELYRICLDDHESKMNIVQDHMDKIDNESLSVDEHCCQYDWQLLQQNYSVVIHHKILDLFDKVYDDYLL